MSNGWYFHDIKVKYFIFIYKSQYIFNVDSLISMLLIFLYWIIPSHFQDVLISGILKAPASFSFFLHSKTFQVCCVYCLLPLSNHWFILQQLKSGVSIIFPVVSILSKTYNTPLTPYWDSLTEFDRVGHILPL